jgi:hypothetical protein
MPIYGLLTPPAAAASTAATSTAAARPAREAAAAPTASDRSLLTQGSALRAPLPELASLASAAHPAKCTARALPTGDPASSSWPLRRSTGGTSAWPANSACATHAADTARPTGTTDATHAADTTRATGTTDATHTAWPTGAADATHAADTTRATGAADATHATDTAWPTGTADSTEAADTTHAADTACAAHAAGTGRRPHRIAWYGDLRAAGKARRSAGRTREIAWPRGPSAPTPTV